MNNYSDLTDLGVNGNFYPVAILFYIESLSKMFVLWSDSFKTWDVVTKLITFLLISAILHHMCSKLQTSRSNCRNFKRIKDLQQFVWLAGSVRVGLLFFFFLERFKRGLKKESRKYQTRTDKMVNKKWCQPLSLVQIFAYLTRIVEF